MFRWYGMVEIHLASAFSFSFSFSFSSTQARFSVSFYQKGVGDAYSVVVYRVTWSVVEK